MAETLPQTLQEKITERLAFYEDLGIKLFYRDRGGAPARSGVAALDQPALPEAQSDTLLEESILAKSAHKTELAKAPPAATPGASEKIVMPPPVVTTLFSAVEKIPGDTLLAIREDLGDCTRCKLSRTRNKLVFGDGNPKAELVFVGEGPGADEDAQGLPFVGRAGKLLTQMIEAMGLQRRDVYICNVVKCRPPGNRRPEPDEVAQCSPFLLRQLDSISPKVIVCLGATAAQLLLQTDKGISQFRGEWLDFRGTKLMATYHPAYLLRNPAAKADVWKDLQKVMARLGLQVKKKATP
ncbi:MAG TPA: uracil-DNA glycosylase [Candidatus Saccharimonadales bacterium]|nr:uracil-DNA glycosylase [Candidatus Saccharimonadales bacterium]